MAERGLPTSQSYRPSIFDLANLSAMVSVFEGQLTRTWFYEHGEKKHVLNLYHDTISGVRSAMLDYQEIRGSLGNSSLLMDSKGHRIFFTIENLPGYIEIKRSGWTSFVYSCCINDRDIKEATQGVPENQDVVFKPTILDTVFTVDDQSEFQIAWYVVKTTRITDGATSTVHRRFREFAELNSQIKQNMKGHHMRDVLPALPEKPLKQFTDHHDPSFIQDRCIKLERFLIAMTSIPHVGNMVCMKAFLGIMDQVREYSLAFQAPTLGLSLLPRDRQGEPGSSPCVVGMIQKPEVCQGVLPGDQLSRVNGVPLQGATFAAAVARIKSTPRPMIVHFIQVINASTTAANAAHASGANPTAALNAGMASATISAPKPVSPIQNTPAGAGASHPIASAHRPHTATYAAGPSPTKVVDPREAARLDEVATVLAAKEAAEKERQEKLRQEREIAEYAAQIERAERAEREEKERLAREERERLERIEKEKERLKEVARQEALALAREKRRKEQLALFMDEPSDSASKSKLFDSAEPAPEVTARPAAQSKIIDTHVVDAAVTSLPTPPAQVTSTTTAPPSVATAASAVPVVDLSAKKSLFAEEVKGFEVAPVVRPASSIAVESTIVPAVQPEISVQTSASNDVEKVTSVPTDNAALLGWD